jgi:nicotinamide mononucleotide transporter
VPAVTPRWATTRERVQYFGFWIGGVVVVQWLFSLIGAGWPAPRWYFWCDAWIFVGSIVATYAMARGWNDFWLAWIAVDLVGVPLLVHSGFYPSAVLYAVYAGLVLYGFVVWLRISRTAAVEPEPSEVMA